MLVRHLLEEGVYRAVGRCGGLVDVTEPVTVTVDVDALFASSRVAAKCALAGTSRTSASLPRLEW